MKFKFSDWLFVIAALLNWVSVAVGNHYWQAWASAILFTVALILHFVNWRHDKAKLVRNG